MEELGSRLKEYRIRKNLQQKELALNAGVGLDTIVRLECGSSISTEKFIRILRVLDMLENIEEFIPEPPISPILMRDLKGKKRYRVRSLKNMDDLIVNVKIWDRLVGALIWDKNKNVASFQFEPKFLRAGLDVSPIVMPLKKSSKDTVLSVF